MIVCYALQAHLYIGSRMISDDVKYRVMFTKTEKSIINCGVGYEPSNQIILSFQARFISPGYIFGSWSARFQLLYQFPYVLNNQIKTLILLVHLLNPVMQDSPKRISRHTIVYVHITVLDKLTKYLSLIKRMIPIQIRGLSSL